MLEMRVANYLRSCRDGANYADVVAATKGDRERVMGILSALRANKAAYLSGGRWYLRRVETEKRDTNVAASMATKRRSRAGNITRAITLLGELAVEYPAHERLFRVVKTTLEKLQKGEK